MPAFTTVDDYIRAQSAQVQPRLRELRAVIRDAVPEAAEVIRFVSIGAARRHCALYGSAMADYADELRAYDTSKGTVRFPLDQPIPAALVRKLVLAKVVGQASRAAAQ